MSNLHGKLSLTNDERDCFITERQFLCEMYLKNYKTVTDTISAKIDIHLENIRKIREAAGEDLKKLMKNYLDINEALASLSLSSELPSNSRNAFTKKLIDLKNQCQSVTSTSVKVIFGEFGFCHSEITGANESVAQANPRNFVGPHSSDSSASEDIIDKYECINEDELFVGRGPLNLPSCAYLQTGISMEESKAHQPASPPAPAKEQYKRSVVSEKLHAFEKKHREQIKGVVGAVGVVGAFVKAFRISRST